MATSTEAALAREFVFQELLEQPAIAARRAAGPAPAWPAAAGRALVTGAGDSLAAAELVAALFPARRLSALPALDASRAALDLAPGDVLVGVSVSGRTARVVEAVRRARARGAETVAVTDDPAGTLAAEAGCCWPIGASPAEALGETGYASPAAREYVGYHHDVAQTKTFLASVLTLARAAAPELDLAPVAAALEASCAPAVRAPLLARAPEWARAGQAFVLASGSALPLARFAAYKLFEFDRLAHFTELEEYCHTHYFVTRPGDALLCVLHDAESARRAAELAPVLRELFDARVIVLRSDDVPWRPAAGVDELVVPAGPHALARHVALLAGLEWITYLWGRVGAPDVNTFHAGYDTERLVAGSLRTIRRSAIDPGPAAG